MLITRRARWVGGSLTLLALAACVRPGLAVRDRAAGDNGDFEVIAKGLPVNWTISRYPIKSGDIEAFSDTIEKVSGARSLRIVVHRYAESERWKPFVFQSLNADEGQTYEVSFWLRSQRCTVLMELGNEGKYHMFGGASEAEIQDYAAHPRISAVLGPAETGTDEWRRFTYRYTVPETDGSLRFELKLRSTGTIWLDDVRFVKVAGAGPR